MPTKVPHTKDKKMTPAEQLAAFVVRMRYEDLSEAARQQLRAHILDPIGCAI
jgi:2-methylcitrate dehydratase